MAVFRVERNKGYTVMSNHHLRNKELTLKAKGLLSQTMKAVNTYYRKNKTLDGCPHLSTEQIEKLKASMSGSYRANPKPFESYQLRKGYSFPMLAMKVFLYSLQHRKKRLCQTP